MFKYKLIDVKQHVEEDVEFGTCDWCMCVGTLEYAIAVVEGSNGKIHEFPNGAWSWGDWYPHCYSDIDNVIDFAYWLSKKEFKKELDALSFWNLANDYNEELKGG